MQTQDFYGRFKNIAARGGIIVFFIMAFEVMIMISPFAFFFYSVFNPVLHWLGDYPATQWLIHFFLPHMILPSSLFLRSIRVLGSILFVIGAVTFTVCALQVYLGKIFKWGIAERGIYRIVRHPQYLALGLWGIGMSILWPRFLVLASLSLMFILYYFLAKDEERRMLDRFGDDYRHYMDRTGMFVPRVIEGFFAAPFGRIQNNALRRLVIAVVIPVVVIGPGFLLRHITLNTLPFEVRRNVTLVSMLPEDEGVTRKLIADVFHGEDAAPALPFLKADKDYLGYVMPADYVMQGMIANTGKAFQLHLHHDTFALIADWVMNPFEHLRRSPMARMAAMHHVDPTMARRLHCPLGIQNPALRCESCPYRRVIFVEIDHAGKDHPHQAGLFAFNAKRVPAGFIDIDTRTGKIIDSEKVGRATAWRDVPTPAI